MDVAVTDDQGVPARSIAPIAQFVGRLPQCGDAGRIHHAGRDVLPQAYLRSIHHGGPGERRGDREAVSDQPISPAPSGPARQPTTTLGEDISTRVPATGASREPAPPIRAAGWRRRAGWSTRS